MYAELKRWQVEVIDSNETEIGGIKEISFIDCFNQFMIEQSKNMNKDIESKT